MNGLNVSLEDWNAAPFQYPALDRRRIESSSASTPDGSTAEPQMPAPPLQPLFQLCSL